MPDDSTLDAFASSDETEREEDAETDETATTAGVDTEESADDADAESAAQSDPVRSTYEWTPDGGECADCGASAERRWRSDGQRDGDLVCADCKEW